MIKLEKIDKSFENHVILKSFSYRFELGKSYGLVGASGSGKTTLLNIIGKLEKADAGEVFVKGKNLKKIREQVYFRDYVGYLFQNYGLIDNETIEQNLALAFVGKKKTSRLEQRKMTIEALEKVNLETNLKRKIFSLSGGEAQRVAIAKVILKQPRIILADEPTASLDEKNGHEVLDLILSNLTERSVVIIATHTPYVWERMDELVRLEKETNYG